MSTVLLTPLRWDIHLSPRNRVKFDEDVAERLANGDALVPTKESITKTSGPMMWRLLIEETNGYVPTLGLVTATCEEFTNTDGMWGLCGRGAWYTSLDCTYEDVNREEKHDKDLPEKKWVFQNGDEVELNYDPATQIFTARVAGKGSTTRRLVGNVKELYPCVWFYNKENIGGQRVRLLGRTGASQQEAEWHQGRVVLIHAMLEKVLSEVSGMRRELKDVRQECRNDIAALRADQERDIADLGSRLGSRLESVAQDVTVVRCCVRHGKDADFLPDSPLDTTTAVVAAVGEGKILQAFRLVFEWATAPSNADLAPLVVSLCRAVDEFTTKGSSRLSVFPADQKDEQNPSGNTINSGAGGNSTAKDNSSSAVKPLLVGEDQTLRRHALLGIAGVLMHMAADEEGKNVGQIDDVQAIVGVLEGVVQGVVDDHPRKEVEEESHQHTEDAQAASWDEVVRTVHVELSGLAVSVSGRKLFGRVLLRRIQQVVAVLMHILS